MARYRPDGTIELLGRTDHQVKIRGHRIELQEIEAVFRQHDAVSDCVTVAREDSPGEKRLVAYCIAAPGKRIEQTELLAFLRTRLPEYMQPARVLELESFPQTPNGKIDRKALPAPGQDAARDSKASEAPMGELEERLASVWAGLLGVRHVARSDRFLELGGDSFMAASLFVKIEKEFGARLPLSTILGDSPLSEVAAILAEHKKIEPQTEGAPRFAAGGAR